MAGKIVCLLSFIDAGHSYGRKIRYGISWIFIEHRRGKFAPSLSSQPDHFEVSGNRGSSLFMSFIESLDLY